MKEDEKQLILIKEKFAGLKVETETETEAEMELSSYVKKVWQEGGIEALNALPIEYLQAWEEESQKRRERRAIEQASEFRSSLCYQETLEREDIETNLEELQAKFRGAMFKSGNGRYGLNLTSPPFTLRNKQLDSLMDFLKAHPEITWLQICNYCATDRSFDISGLVDVKAFFSRFKHNTTVTTLELDLILNPMEDADAEILAKFLEADSQLTNFIMRRTFIPDSGIETIAKALEKNVTLKNCSIINDFTYYGLKFLNMFVQLEKERSNSRQAAELLAKDENIPGTNPPLLQAFRQHVSRDPRLLTAGYLAVPTLKCTY